MPKSIASMSTDELSSEITRLSGLYYEGTPEVSDTTFDLMVDELTRRDPSNKVLHTIGFGYQVDQKLDTVVDHDYEIAKFEGKVKDVSGVPNRTNPNESTISAKIDGGSVILYYKHGSLYKAVTRGDGRRGYDLTRKMKLIVPSVLKDHTFSGMIRGEIAMANDVFDKKYRPHGYSSARNLAIGIIKRNTLSVEEARDLAFVAYTVRGTTSQDLTSKMKVLKWLRANEFESVDVFHIDNWSNDSFRDAIKSYNKYPIDGIVITSNQYNRMDDGTYVPNTEVAYKTDAEVVEVTVTDITWGLTRTGRLVPRVWFDPVYISGANVQKATAFNAGFVRDTGLGIGSHITVMRSGEVIPDIQEVLTKVDYHLPNKCPVCHADLSWTDKDLKCNNPDCSGQSYGAVFHWIGTIANIKGLGGSTIADFCDKLDISSVDDLYAKIDLIPSLYDKQSATRQKIEEMTNKLTSPIDLSTLLVACNIPMLGWKAAEKVNDQYQIIIDDPVDSHWVDRVYALPGINRTGKSNLISNIDKIRRYATYIGIRRTDEVSDTTTDHPYDDSARSTTSDTDPNKVVAITGKLSIPRNDFIAEIAKYGWSVGGVTKNTRYLITDTPYSGSSKNKKAQSLGVEVISEDDFRKIMTS